MGRLFAIAIAATALMSSGCEGLLAARPSQSPAQPASAAPESNALGRGDVLEVKVFREPELAGVYRVSSEGDITFPLVGKIALRGLEPDEVAEAIRKRLAEGYLKDPQVTVFVRETNSQKIHVLGQVTKAGTFPYELGMTVIQAVTNAGGFTKLAATNRVSVTRVVDGAEQRHILPVGDIGSGRAPNFDLRPGDIVFVPEAIF